jgi:PTS system nitrogen regulatory IIA component
VSGLSSQLDESRVAVGLRARTKDEALRAVAKLFAKGHPGIDADRAYAEMKEREEIAQTGIGDGLALPHGKADGIKKPIHVLAVSPDGIEWDSADGRPVHVVAATLAPEKSAADPVKLLARVARVFKDDGVRRRLVEARSPAAAIEALEAAE